MPLTGDNNLLVNETPKTEAIILIEKGEEPLAVNIRANLTQICKTGRMLYELRKDVKSATEKLEKNLELKNELKIKSFNYLLNYFTYKTIESNIVEQTAEIQKLNRLIEFQEKKYKEIYSEFVECVRGTMGASYWTEILKIIRAQVNDLAIFFKEMYESNQSLLNSSINKYFGTDNKNYDLNLLSNQLNKINSVLNLTNNQPLVFECLQTSLIELIKNSIDAMIKKYLNQLSEDTNLNMIFQVHPEEEDLIVTFSDNAGGLSDERLTEFKYNLSLPIYPVTHTNSQKTETYYLGGHGQGLAILFSFILNGTLLLGENKERVYNVENSKTNASIENINHEDGKCIGAKIKLASPYYQFPAFNSESQEEVTPLTTSLKALTTPQAFFSPQVWKQNRKAKMSESAVSYGHSS